MSRPLFLRGKRTVRDDIAWGATYGVQFAVFYALIAVAVGVLRGLTSGGELLRRLPPVIVAYFAVGPVAGAIIGLCRPLTRWRAGLVLVTMIAAVPVFAGIATAVDGLPWRWKSGTLTSVLFVAALVGGLIGLTQPLDKDGRDS
ncbi:MAG: hypothetical protein NVSMB53_17130 [Gemmatimonadaceae bacterium]